MRLSFLSTISLLSLTISAASSQPTTTRQQQANPAPKVEPIVSRLFFQDHESKTIRWADVRNGVPPTLDPIQDVANFPQLDTDRQGLVQMREAKGTLLVGIRDDADGEFGSGWALVTTGVSEEAHGDHSHWRYKSAPETRQAVIDEQQGNPAHLYEYDGVFYLANDRKEGYTRLDPATVPSQGDVPTGFHKGGGGHITLAVANGNGFSTWIDREGDKTGRVDVTPINPTGNNTIASTFTLPSGGIHGATAAANKVFFAPAEGICWVDAKSPSASIKVNHISLGTDPETDKPLRTGAFTVYRNRVLFVTGDGGDATLAMIDARAAAPKIVTLKVPGKPGSKPVTPACVRTSRGKHYAFIFHDASSHEDDGEDSADHPEESLAVIDLDPNNDGHFTDAKIAKTITVGASKVEGHNGHHSIDFDGDGRRAYFTNPGDGTITILRLDNLEPATTLTVGGMPTALIVTGGRETRD